MLAGLISLPLQLAAQKNCVNASCPRAVEARKLSGKAEYDGTANNRGHSLPVNQYTESDDTARSFSCIALAHVLRYLNPDASAQRGIEEKEYEIPASAFPQKCKKISKNAT
jgi:hypothetical protein